MKKMTKRIFALVFAVLITAALCTLAFASEAEYGAVAELDGGVAVQGGTEPMPDADTEGVEGAKNPFDTVCDAIMEHLDEILSALAFIGSALLAFTYKRGLLPSLSGALNKIGASVRSVSDAAEKQAESQNTTLAVLGERVGSIADTFDKVAKDVSALDERLGAAEAGMLDRKTMEAIMGAQIDMLYQIFMTSSLPQYAKDEVGTRIAEMKAALEGGAKNE